MRSAWKRAADQFRLLVAEWLLCRAAMIAPHDHADGAAILTGVAVTLAEIHRSAKSAALALEEGK